MKKPRRISEKELKTLSKDEQAKILKEKKDWKNYLDNETNKQRFERIAKPRLKRLFNELDNFETMVKSPRYDIPFNILNDVLEKIQNKCNQIRNSYSGTKEDKKNIVDEIFTHD